MKCTIKQNEIKVADHLIISKVVDKSLPDTGSGSSEFQFIRHEYGT